MDPKIHNDGVILASIPNFTFLCPSLCSLTSQSHLCVIGQSVADLGFPRGGGANPPGEGRQHTILPKFPKNYMKFKKILLCRSATASNIYKRHKKAEHCLNFVPVVKVLWYFTSMTLRCDSRASTRQGKWNFLQVKKLSENFGHLTVKEFFTTI